MSKAKSPRSVERTINKKFRDNMKLLLESMEGLEPSSRAYLDRLTAKAKLEREYLETLVSFGLVPRNLGSLRPVSYVFTAIIPPAEDTRTAERKLWEEKLNEEFATTPNPAPEPAKSRKKGKQ